MGVTDVSGPRPTVQWSKDHYVIRRVLASNRSDEFCTLKVFEEVWPNGQVRQTVVSKYRLHPNSDLIDIFETGFR
jgi:hypothetical protein